MTKSAASRTAALLGLRRDDEDEDFGNPGIFAMSVRLPSNVACRISVMADLAKCSRNEMVNMIVEAGLEAISAVTSEDALLEIHLAVEDQLDNFIS